jgi:hypothetical protein
VITRSEIRHPQRSPTEIPIAVKPWTVILAIGITHSSVVSDTSNPTTRSTLFVIKRIALAACDFSHLPRPELHIGAAQAT